MSIRKGWVVRILLGASMLLAGPSAYAEETARKADVLTTGVTAFSKKALTVFKTGCSAGRLLGLCAESLTDGLPPRSLSLGGLYSGFRVRAAAKAAPNRFFQLVKLFIDDLEVAQIGDYKLRLSIEIK